MTLGTSPRAWGTFSAHVEAAAEAVRAAAARMPDLRLDGTRIARIAAALYLAGLCIVLTTAWNDPSLGPGGATFGLPTWHLAFLLVSGATATLLTLARGATDDGVEQAADPSASPDTGLNELMAQMSHELRTPLNAVIGFSEVMSHELHGPLGNARYQEYAHHISESGGRLLKSSEEALAVTEVMTALMADRRRGKRERLAPEAMVRDAWRAVTARMASDTPALELARFGTGVLICERRPVAQALEHLLREASSKAGDSKAVRVAGRRRASRQFLEIRVGDAAEASRPARPSPDAGHASDLAGRNLGVILAKLLLETQGAKLTYSGGAAGWTATVEFPAKE